MSIHIWQYLRGNINTLKIKYSLKFEIKLHQKKFHIYYEEIRSKKHFSLEKR